MQVISDPGTDTSGSSLTSEGGDPDSSDSASDATSNSGDGHDSQSDTSDSEGDGYVGIPSMWRLYGQRLRVGFGDWGTSLRGSSTLPEILPIPPC